jgi:endonuclease III
MKNGSEYARRIKRLFRQLQRESGGWEPGEPTDPLEQLVVAVLSARTTPEQGRKALRRLSDHMVDFNELRVSAPAEVSVLIKDLIPDNSERAKALLAVLNAVYQAEYAVDLRGLRDLGLREARKYLESLDGSDPHAAASVLLWSLGGHAIPVSPRLLEALRAGDLVDTDSTLPEVQSFLERHISATDARLFCHLMESYASGRARGGSEKSSTSSPRKPVAAKTVEKPAKRTRAGAASVARKKKARS